MEGKVVENLINKWLHLVVKRLQVSLEADIIFHQWVITLLVIDLVANQHSFITRQRTKVWLTWIGCIKRRPYTKFSSVKVPRKCQDVVIHSKIICVVTVQNSFSSVKQPDSVTVLYPEIEQLWTSIGPNLSNNEVWRGMCTLCPLFPSSMG